jgi:aspartyl-tRNA(Asn)/glutamyl-tRNA(Gln) amidotransferase subunit C
MSLTPHDVENIARLARLAITPAERASLSDSLPRILTFVEQLSAAETSNVEPMAHPLDGLSQRLRSDTVSETDAHERFQQNAARVEAGLYLVPKVIE